MKTIKPIKTDYDYQQALASLEKVFDAEPDSSDADIAELLIILIQDYERNHFPIEAPTPIEAIKFRMEQMNLRQADLAKLLGSESRVSEILNGRRALTVNMIAAINSALNIPLESLITTRKRTIRIKQKTRYKANRESNSLLEEPKVKFRKKKRG